MRKVGQSIAWVLTIALLSSQMPLQVFAQEEQSVQIISVSDSDILISEEEDILFDGENMAESMVTVDISDMIYQSGGLRAPMEAGGNVLYALYAMEERDGLREEILQALQEEANVLDVRGYELMVEDMDDVQILFAEVVNGHPDLFYVESSIAYRYDDRTNRVQELYFFYEDFSWEEREAYAAKLEQVTSLVTSDMTDVERALVLHDYLAQHCAYPHAELLEDNLTDRNVYTAYGALVEGKAVCQGYALAYCSLLHYVGIDSSMCTSNIMNHAWNVVLIDGEWYHVDVTWDDPTWNIEGRARHAYFLLSDTEMQNRGHEGWKAIVECTSEKYDSEDYWWNAAKSRILAGDKQYYIESMGRGFQLTERDGDVSSAKYVNNTVWEVWGQAGYWSGSYAYLSGQGDYIYFNDKQNLYAMSLTDSIPQVIYTYEGGDGYIYGAMVYEDGTARLNIDQTPNRDSDSFITVDLRAEAPTPTIDYETGTVSTTADMEYSIDSGMTWNCCTENMNITDFGWNGIREVTVFFRIPEAGGRFTSETTVISLKALPGSIVGKVICFGNEAALTTLQLEDSNGAVVCETAVTHSNAEYVMKNVEEGTYILKVSRQNHVTREYILSVGEASIIQDVELHLAGDVNGDGEMDAKDKRIIYNHMEAPLLTGYEFLVGDVDGSGEIDARDKRMIFNHIAGNSLLW